MRRLHAHASERSYTAVLGTCISVRGRDCAATGADSRKVDPRTKRRRNLGTFATRAAAEKHERAVQFFKRH